MTNVIVVPDSFQKKFEVFRPYAPNGWTCGKLFGAMVFGFGMEWVLPGSGALMALVVVCAIFVHEMSRAPNPTLSPIGASIFLAKPGRLEHSRYLQLSDIKDASEVWLVPEHVRYIVTVKDGDNVRMTMVLNLHFSTTDPNVVLARRDLEPEGLENEIAHVVSKTLESVSLFVGKNIPQLQQAISLGLARFGVESASISDVNCPIAQLPPAASA